MTWTHGMYYSAQAVHVKGRTRLEGYFESRRVRLSDIELSTAGAKIGPSVQGLLDVDDELERPLILSGVKTGSHQDLKTNALFACSFKVHLLLPYTFLDLKHLCTFWGKLVLSEYSCTFLLL